MGIESSQCRVTLVTDRGVGQTHNRFQEAHMPILIIALVALAAFGTLGVMLSVAVACGQRKIHGKHPQPGKTT